jgi:hypothetical protein
MWMASRNLVVLTAYRGSIFSYWIPVSESPRMKRLLIPVLKETHIQEISANPKWHG